MGIIQNAINQTLGTAAIAARLSPLAEKQADKQALKKLKKEGQALESLQEGTDFSEATVETLTKEQTDVAKNIAKLEPTKENFKSYVDYAESLEAMQPENIAAEQELARKREEATLRSSGLQANGANQMKTFKEYTAFITDPAKVQEEFNKLKGGK